MATRRNTFHSVITNAIGDRHSNASGFTLLEIVVVLALVGLIFGAATTRFETMFRAGRLQAGARGLGDHFAYVISRSYTAGKYHTMTFDLTAGGYWFTEGRQDEESPAILKRGLAKGVAFADIQLGYDTYTPPGTLSIEVSPIGVTNDVLINLEDDEGGAGAVWLNAFVQSVTYFDEHKEYEELQDVPTF